MSIPYPSLAVDNESDSKFKYNKETESGQKSLFSWLLLAQTFASYLPRANSAYVWTLLEVWQTCWFLFLQMLAGIPADRSRSYLPGANSFYPRTLLEVRQSCWFLWLLFLQTTAGIPADCFTLIHFGNSILYTSLKWGVQNSSSLTSLSTV